MSQNNFKSRLYAKFARNLASRAARSRIATRLKRVRLSNSLEIQSFTSFAELCALMDLAASCPADSTILEIGSYLGKSTCFLAAGLASKGGRIYCVDTWQNETMPDGVRDTKKEFQRNIAPVAHLIHLVEKNSEDLVISDIKPPVRLAFIDGDHSYAAVKKDFEKILPWMTQDATIAFHDSRDFRGVSRVIGEALSTGDWKVGGNVENLLWVERARWNNCWTQRGEESP